MKLLPIFNVFFSCHCRKHERKKHSEREGGDRDRERERSHKHHHRDSKERKERSVESTGAVPRSVSARFLGSFTQ